MTLALQRHYKLSRNYLQHINRAFWVMIIIANDLWIIKYLIALPKPLSYLFIHLTILSGVQSLNANEDTPNTRVFPADSNPLLRSHRYCLLFWWSVWLLPPRTVAAITDRFKPSGRLNKVNCQGAVFSHLCPVFTWRLIHATFSPKLSASWRLIGPLNSCALALWLKQLDTV